MKDTTIIEIADKLNIGKSTVSRAIRHCSGVDSDTRASVLQEIGLIHYHPESNCDIYTILPNVPQYFWDSVLQGILSEQKNVDFKIKHNIYTKLHDEDTILRYLDEAECMNARAIIIAAHITPEIHNKLSALSYRRLVLILSEYCEIKNCFYVGADMYNDGYLMGMHYLTSHADKKLVVLHSPGSQSINLRMNGFLNAVRTQQPVYIEVEDNLIRNPKTLPSKLAPLLLNAVGDNDSLCIYAPFSIHALPLAIKKAKLSGKVVCLCHDFFASTIDTCVDISCNQDAIMQGKTAMQLAIRYLAKNMYPDTKNTYISSTIYN